MLTTKQLLALSPTDAIAAMFNDINPGMFLIGSDVIYGLPQSQGDTLTQVLMTMRQKYSAIDAIQYQGSFTFTYNRLNIADFAALAFSDYQPELPITTLDLLARLEELFGCEFNPYDFVIEPITAANAANYTLKTQPNSLRWVGTATVNIGAGGVIFIEGSPPDAIINVPYSFTFTTEGGVPPFVWSANNLPDGLSINSQTGEVTGSATVLGPFYSTIIVVDSQQTQQQAGVVFTVVPATLLNPRLVVVDPTYDSATVGVPYSDNLPLAGGDGTYNSPVLTQGTMPPGLSLSLNGANLVMSGTPTAPFFGLIEVGCSSGDGQQVRQLLQFVTLPPMSIVGSFMSIPVNTTFTDFLVIQGGSGDYFGPILVDDSELPPGIDTLIIDHERLEIRGTPTQQGTFPFTVKILTGYNQSFTTTLSLTVT